MNETGKHSYILTPEKRDIDSGFVQSDPVFFEVSEYSGVDIKYLVTTSFKKVERRKI